MSNKLNSLVQVNLIRFVIFFSDHNEISDFCSNQLKVKTVNECKPTCPKDLKPRVRTKSQLHSILKLFFPYLF